MSLNLKSAVISSHSKNQFELELQNKLATINSEDLIDVKFATHGLVGMPTVYSAVILYKLS